MKNEVRNDIDFDKVILTPIGHWIETELNLEKEVVRYLNDLAQKCNQSVENVLNHILADMSSEHLELNQLTPENLCQLGEKYRRIIITDNGKAVARVELLDSPEKEMNSIAVMPKPKQPEDCTIDILP